jgi:hypothetical protein
MKRAALAVAALAAFAAVLAVPSLGARARQREAVRFEYLRLTPGLPQPNPAVMHLREGYQGCAARAAKWVCREFETDEGSPALAHALAALGAEGWELVSAIDETEHQSYPRGLTYVFKRQLP